MSYLALGKCSNDLLINPDGGFFRVTDGRFVIQQVQCKLKTALGEWILDPKIGYVNTNDLIKNFDLFDLESRMVEIILGTQGVLEVIEVTTQFIDRKLRLDFKARTIYGIIDTSVPWTCGEGVVPEEEGPAITQFVIHNGVQVVIGGINVTKT